MLVRDSSHLEKEIRTVVGLGKARQAVVPNPKAKLLDKVQEVMRFRICSQAIPATKFGFPRYCLSYSPLLTFLSTVNPAFFASEIDTAFGELNVENSLRTGFLQAGQWVNGLASSGRRSVKRPPHTLQSPSQSSYSYRGMIKIPAPGAPADKKVRRFQPACQSAADKPACGGGGINAQI